MEPLAQLHQPRCSSFLLLQQRLSTPPTTRPPGPTGPKTPEGHARIAHIDPRLNVKSFWAWNVRTFLFSPFVPRWRSRSLRLDRLQRAPDRLTA